MHSFSKSEFNGSRLVANLDRGHADIGIVPPVASGPSFAPAGAVSFGGPLGSGFWAQIVLMQQSVPCGRDGILDAHQISAFSGEDVNRPIRVKRSVDLVRYFDIGHILASGEAADFLERYALQLMLSNERFGHRAGRPLNQSILAARSSCRNISLLFVGAFSDIPSWCAFAEVADGDRLSSAAMSSRRCF
jgi:hypothetical protein